jgi:hypothetical protein
MGGLIQEDLPPMLSDADRRKAADILINAERERKQAVQPKSVS